MAYAPYPTGTLLIPSGPNASGKHLFVIMNAACPNAMHILYSISSIKRGQKYDTTCEFRGGEHEFVIHPSYVYYRDPQQRTTAHITKCVDNKLYITKADLAGEHFKRICDGISVSPFTRPWAEKYCRDNGII